MRINLLLTLSLLFPVGVRAVTPGVSARSFRVPDNLCVKTLAYLPKSGQTKEYNTCWPVPSVQGLTPEVIKKIAVDQVMPFAIADDAAYAAAIKQGKAIPTGRK